MDSINFSQEGFSFQIEGYPDAVKVVRINGPKAKRLADLTLHRDDLDFAESCLNSMAVSPEDPIIIKEALWRMAVITFIKCFGNSASRSRLLSKKIYNSDPPEAFAAFKYFLSLRNKHFIHDENSYSQCTVGALLNNGNKSYNVEKIVCSSFVAGTFCEGNYNNLMLLIRRAKDWVITEFDELAALLTTDLEIKSYEELIDKEPIGYMVPHVGEIHGDRH